MGRPRPKPLLIYDSSCDFCCRTVMDWKSRTLNRVDYVPYQEIAGEFPEIAAERLARSLHFIDTDGAIYHGAEALFRALAHAPGNSWMLWAYRTQKTFKFLSDAAYAVVAANRKWLSALTSHFGSRKAEPRDPTR